MNRKSRASRTAFVYQLIIFAGLLAPPSFASAPVGDMPFPRLGALAMGAKDYQREEYRAELSRADLVVLGFYRGWRNDGMTVRDVLQDLKRRNQDILLGTYTSVSEVFITGATRDITEKIERERGPGGAGRDWWARNKDGERISTWPNTFDVNITEFAKPDSNGDRFPEYMAKRYYSIYFRDIPEFDFVFLDIARIGPKGSPDWNGDGVNDSRENDTSKTWWRQGIINYVEKLRSLDPSLFFIGNTTTWREYDIPQYHQVFDGGLMERLIGASYSYEGSNSDGTVNRWGSWSMMMDVYRSQKAQMRDPAVMLFTMAGQVDDYPLMRYGLTSCLLDDGFFAFIDVENVHSSNPWFDEYAVELGAALDLPPTEPWRNGVYRRDFENGVVLVNPRKNGPQTLQLEPGLKRFLGSQDPSHNNGQRVETITLADRDGIILLRDGPRAAKPSPPTGLYIADQ